jgi:uncharacterized membrane protein
MILMVIALLPINIFQSANYTYDIWLIGLSMLGFAYLFSEMQEPDSKVSVRSCVVMITAMFLAVCVKAVYFPLILALLLLSKNKFQSIRQYNFFRIGVITATVITLMSFALPFVVEGPGQGDMRGGSDVNATEQVKFILSNPFGYAVILLNFLRHYLSLSTMPDYTVLHGYLGHSSNFLLVFLLLIIVVLTDKHERDKYVTNIRTRLAVVSACFITVCLVATALYIAFTAVGLDTVMGCQPRYILPVVFPACFILGSCKIVNNINRAFYNNAVLAVSSFILLQGAWQLLVSRYY